MKTQSSGMEAEAGQNLKRAKIKKGKSTVNGHAVFENGNLVKPKVEQEIVDFVVKKKQLEKPRMEQSSSRTIQGVEKEPSRAV